MRMCEADVENLFPPNPSKFHQISYLIGFFDAHQDMKYNLTKIDFHGRDSGRVDNIFTLERNFTPPSSP